MLTFQELYDSYAADIYRFALWLSGDNSDAEDITSETFVRAWVRNNSIKTETLKGYLLTIARNIYLGKLRKLNRQVDLDSNFPDPTPGPEAVVETQLELIQVRKVLQTLSEIDRTAFVLRVLNEMTYAEIARVLGLSLSATKVKVHRVRKKLLVAFAEKEIE
jgi:RNA polymerase sigma-70 factor (ECF subfamily)